MVQSHNPERIVYTIPQVAKMLGSNEPYVRSLIKSGNLKAIKLGNYKISRKELDSFLDRSAGIDYSDPFNPKPINLN